jgi:hypothetical protein
MHVLRFLMLLSLVVWIGGIIFFAFVVAPTAFGVLPASDLAGRVVGHSLRTLHWIGIVSGIVFLAFSMLFSFWQKGSARPLSAHNVFVILMIVLTVVSTFVIGAKMFALTSDVGPITQLAPNDPRRVEFDELHHWSVRLEIGVLALGLAALYRTAKAISA